MTNFFCAVVGLLAGIMTALLWINYSLLRIAAEIRKFNDRTKDEIEIEAGDLRYRGPK